MPVIKNRYILAGIFFLSLSFVSAESKLDGYSLFTHTYTGILYGQAQEIVYKYPGENQFLSQLHWDLKPLIYLGFGADFGRSKPFEKNGFIAALSCKFGLPLKTGSHENRDWLNPDNEWQTHYSWHDAYSQNAFHFDLSCGYSWYLDNTFTIRFHADFSFMGYTWSGEDGYIQYPTNSSGEYIYETAPEWHNNLKKDYVSGIVIVYTQSWFLVSPGISFKAKLGSKFGLEGHFNYSPLAFCIARDDHLFGLNSRYSKGASYWDVLQFGEYISAGSKLSFLPNQFFDLSLSASYRFIDKIRGRTYKRDTGIGNNQAYMTSLDGGGARYSAFDIQLSARLRAHDWFTKQNRP